jgi:hypothetical protein
MRRLDAESTALEPLLATPAIETNAQLSTNGRFIAYQFRESENDGEDDSEIYVRPFPNIDGGLWQVSTDGGTRPLWSPDGSELFFLNGDNPDLSLMSVAVEAEAAFRFGSPVRVFGGNYVTPRSGRQIYDVSPDGERFLFIAPNVQVTEPSIRINVVQNWLEELKARVPVD